MNKLMSSAASSAGDLLPPLMRITTPSSSSSSSISAGADLDSPHHHHHVHHSNRAGISPLMRDIKKCPSGPLMDTSHAASLLNDFVTGNCTNNIAIGHNKSLSSSSSLMMGPCGGPVAGVASSPLYALTHDVMGGFGMTSSSMSSFSRPVGGPLLSCDSSSAGRILITNMK